jgi:hypothetical protein
MSRGPRHVPNWQLLKEHVTVAVTLPQVRRGWVGRWDRLSTSLGPGPALEKRPDCGAHRAGFRGFELLGAQLAGQRLETDRTADANYLDELPFFGRCAWFVCRARVNGRYRRRRNSTRLIKMRTQLGGSADVFECLPERAQRARRRPLSKNSSWCVCAERTFGQAQSGS